MSVPRTLAFLVFLAVVVGWKIERILSSIERNNAHNNIGVDKVEAEV